MGLALSIYLECSFRGAQKLTIRSSGRDAELISTGDDNLIWQTALKVASDVDPTDAEVVWQRAKTLRAAKKDAEADELMRRLADENWPERYQGIHAHAREQLQRR